MFDDNKINEIKSYKKLLKKVDENTVFPFWTNDNFIIDNKSYKKVKNYILKELKNKSKNIKNETFHKKLNKVLIENVENELNEVFFDLFGKLFKKNKKTEINKTMPIKKIMSLKGFYSDENRFIKNFCEIIDFCYEFNANSGFVIDNINQLFKNENKENFENLRQLIYDECRAIGLLIDYRDLLKEENVKLEKRITTYFLRDKHIQPMTSARRATARKKVKENFENRNKEVNKAIEKLINSTRHFEMVAQGCNTSLIHRRVLIKLGADKKYENVPQIKEFFELVLALFQNTLENYSRMIHILDNFTEREFN